MSPKEKEGSTSLGNAMMWAYDSNCHFSQSSIGGPWETLNKTGPVDGPSQKARRVIRASSESSTSNNLLHTYPSSVQSSELLLVSGIVISETLLPDERETEDMIGSL